MAVVDTLHGRRARVVIARPLANDFRTFSAAVHEIEALRITFEVKKSAAKDPNSADVTVTNLSPRSRAELQTKGAKIALLAGYESGMEQIFQGDLRWSETKTEGPNTVTKFQAGDGERAYLHASVSDSFKAGTPASDVVRGITKKLGIDPGQLDKALGRAGARQFVGGYVAHGRAAKELDVVLAALGYVWSIQDGTLQLAAASSGLPAGNVAAVALSPDTGLVGSPEQGTAETKGGPPLTKFRSMINGKIKPGGYVEITSRERKGTYLVRKVRHFGDTHGQDWFTEGEALLQ